MHVLLVIEHGIRVGGAILQPWEHLLLPSILLGVSSALGRGEQCPVSLQGLAFSGGTS